MRYERQMIVRQRPPKTEEKEGEGVGEKVNWQTEKLATVHAMRLGRMRDMKPRRGGKRDRPRHETCQRQKQTEHQIIKAKR